MDLQFWFTLLRSVHTKIEICINGTINLKILKRNRQKHDKITEKKVKIKILVYDLNVSNR